MAWPTANEYRDALQHPLRHFAKPEWKRSQAALDDDGKPRVHTGKWVDVYELRDANGQQRWAIGCFTQPPKGLPRRYHVINEYLAQHPVPALVETTYHIQGVSIRGKWFPVTCNHWIEGLPLNTYVREYLDHPDELRALAGMWLRLAQDLEHANIVHGSLCPDTVLAAQAPGGTLTLRLLDYDGISVPGLIEPLPLHTAHPDFQHPQGCGQPATDRFAQLVVLTALHGLAVLGRQLWEDHNNGNNLLFTASDFKLPAMSVVFRELWQSESSKVRALAGLLVLACQGAPDTVPELKVLADCLKPGGAKAALSGKQIADINRLIAAGQPKEYNLEIDETPPSVTARNETTVEEVPPTAIQAGPPPLPTSTPPPLPENAVEHPLTRTFELEAWMPERIAMVKLQGLVRDLGGKVVKSVPGYIQVQLLDRDNPQPSSPGILSWLGLSESTKVALRVLAVMELNLVQKPTPSRTMIAISVRLTPAADEDDADGWGRFCEQIYCELRGHVMGHA